MPTAWIVWMNLVKSSKEIETGTRLDYEPFTPNQNAAWWFQQASSESLHEANFRPNRAKSFARVKTRRDKKDKQGVKMKAIQAEQFGCTDLSQVELEQTKGGVNPIAIGLALTALKKLWDAITSVNFEIGSGNHSTNTVQTVMNGVTNTTTSITIETRSIGCRYGQSSACA